MLGITILSYRVAIVGINLMILGFQSSLCLVFRISVMVEPGLIKNGVALVVVLTLTFWFMKRL